MKDSQIFKHFLIKRKRLFLFWLTEVKFFEWNINAQGGGHEVRPKLPELWTAAMFMLYKSSVDGRIVSSSPNTQIHLHHICFTFKNALQPCIPSAQVYISTFILKRLKAKCRPARKTLAQSKFFFVCLFFCFIIHSSLFLTLSFTVAD